MVNAARKRPGTVTDVTSLLAMPKLINFNRCFTRRKLPGCSRINGQRNQRNEGTVIVGYTWLLFEATLDSGKSADIEIERFESQLATSICVADKSISSVTIFILFHHAFEGCVKDFTKAKQIHYHDLIGLICQLLPSNLNEPRALGEPPPLAKSSSDGCQMSR